MAMEISELILNALVIFGSVCVFITFGFMMPLVANTMLTLFGVVLGEQALCKLKGIPSGTDWIDEEPSS
jgi:hypothetical protein